MRYEFANEPTTLTLNEVVDQITACGEIDLDYGDSIRSATLECGCELEVVVQQADGRTYERTFTEIDLANLFYEGCDLCRWTIGYTDEGNCEGDILACF